MVFFISSIYYCSTSNSTVEGGCRGPVAKVYHLCSLVYRFVLEGANLCSTALFSWPNDKSGCCGGGKPLFLRQWVQISWNIFKIFLISWKYLWALEGCYVMAALVYCEEVCSVGDSNGTDDSTFCVGWGEVPQGDWCTVRWNSGSQGSTSVEIFQVCVSLWIFRSKSNAAEERLIWIQSLPVRWYMFCHLISEEMSELWSGFVLELSCPVLYSMCCYWVVC